MEVAKYLYGGAAYRGQYQVGVTHSVAGIPTLQVAAAGSGLAIGTVTSAADLVGITLDTATYVTAQQTDGTSAERLVTVDIRPDIVVSSRISGTTASGGAISTDVITTATTDGLDVTTATDWTSTSYDEGTVFGYTGANAGQIRKITSVSSTAATVTVAFDNDHQVGDQFLRFPFAVMDVGSPSVTLTTELNEVRQNLAISSSAAEFVVTEILAQDQAHDGTTQSYVLMVPNDHILNKLS